MLVAEYCVDCGTRRRLAIYCTGGLLSTSCQDCGGSEFKTLEELLKHIINIMKLLQAK